MHVSPDPDLVTYWLADVIDERGYGLRGDTFEVMAALEAAGRETWFRLGDRDLAMCLLRTELLRHGERLTEAHAAVVGALGVERAGAADGGRAGAHPRASPRTRARLPGVHDRGARRRPGRGRRVPRRRGRRARRPRCSPRSPARTSSSSAPRIPSPRSGRSSRCRACSEALTAAAAPVVAVSPFVGGRAVKGPTELFCESAGIERSAQGIADHYGDLIDGMVADEPVEGPGAPAARHIDGRPRRARPGRRGRARAGDLALTRKIGFSRPLAAAALACTVARGMRTRRRPSDQELRSRQDAAGRPARKRLEAGGGAGDVLRHARTRSRRVPGWTRSRS